MNAKIKHPSYILQAMIILIALVGVMLVVLGFQRAEIDDLQSQLEDVMLGEIELEKCPMCGNEDIKLEPIGDDFVIKCGNFGDTRGCGLSTGYYKSKKI